MVGTVSRQRQTGTRSVPHAACAAGQKGKELTRGGLRACCAWCRGAAQNSRNNQMLGLLSAWSNETSQSAGACAGGCPQSESRISAPRISLTCAARERGVGGREGCHTHELAAGTQASQPRHALPQALAGQTFAGMKVMAMIACRDGTQNVKLWQHKSGGAPARR